MYQFVFSNEIKNWFRSALQPMLKEDAIAITKWLKWTIEMKYMLSRIVAATVRSIDFDGDDLFIWKYLLKKIHGFVAGSRILRIRPYSDKHSPPEQAVFR